ncbi:MAG: hypothetical protein ACSHW1_01065 [Yoonia sp.]|uniref:hypothetical protein n=1 Tax=Yoonia sp. TaxID=2212373 RepID=UPI003EF20183
MSNRQVLLIIVAFLTLTIGSFVWFIATWDNREAGTPAPSFILAQKLPPEAPALTTGTNL